MDFLPPSSSHSRDFLCDTLTVGINDILSPTDPKQTTDDFSVTLSTTFHLSSDHGDGGWDIVLVSGDSVQFHVRSSRLLQASSTSFNSLLLPFHDRDTISGPFTPCILLPESFYVVEAVLHVIYDIPFQRRELALDELLLAVKALRKYGIPLNDHVIPGQHLFERIVLQVHQDPLEVYAVSAEYDLFNLAHEASEHLLTLPLVLLSEEMTSRLGPAYLHMLYSLHLARVYLLQRILTITPAEHDPVAFCGEHEYQKLTLSWCNATCKFTSHANPSLLASDIRTALGSVHSPCRWCQENIQRCIDEAAQRWSKVPRNISRNMQEFYAVLSP